MTAKQRFQSSNIICNERCNRKEIVRSLLNKILCLGIEATTSNIDLKKATLVNGKLNQQLLLRGLNLLTISNKRRSFRLSTRSPLGNLPLLLFDPDLMICTEARFDTTKPLCYNYFLELFGVVLVALVG